jgi:hypothetical protein
MSLIAAAGGVHDQRVDLYLLHPRDARSPGQRGDHACGGVHVALRAAAEAVEQREPAQPLQQHARGVVIERGEGGGDVAVQLDRGAAEPHRDRRGIAVLTAAHAHEQLHPGLRHGLHHYAFHLRVGHGRAHRVEHPAAGRLGTLGVDSDLDRTELALVRHLG